MKKKKMSKASKKESKIDKIMNMIEAKYLKGRLVESWELEKKEVRATLNNLPNEIKDVYKIESCIAVAGSRIVLKVIEIESEREFALKICRPFEIAIELVKKEYTQVHDLYHPNLVKIFWAKEIPLSRGGKNKTGEQKKIPITLEEFIPDGQNLSGWLRKQLDNVNEEKDILICLRKIRDIFIQIIEGIHYLHEKKVFHCDIKPENILVSDEVVKIVDFGYSKRLFPNLNYFDEKSNSKIGFTWEYALPGLRKSVEEMPSRYCAIALDTHKFSYIEIDMYALGRTIEECIKRIIQTRQNIEQKILEKGGDSKLNHSRESEYWEKYMRLIADRLKGEDSLEDEPKNYEEIKKFPLEIIRVIQYHKKHIIAFEDAIDDLKRIDVDNLGTIAPEWDRSLADRIRIGYLEVPFTPRIRRLYNHPALSRLNRFSQLGIVGLIYPAAKHSRLEHSMGTYAYACKYIESMWEQKDHPFFRCITPPEEIIAASLGALFHDIGQYPHCHDIEDALPSITEHQKFAQELYEKSWDIGGKSIPSLYEYVKEGWGESVADNVKRYLGFPPLDGGLSDPKEGILWGIISGPVDADKLDYVQRDSINLGIGFGVQIERDRLIQYLRPVIRAPAKSQLPLITVGVMNKGLLAAQSLIVGREQLVERVYWHKTVRSFKAMLSTALRKGLKNTDELNDLIREIIRCPSTLRDSNCTENQSESYHLTESDYLMLCKLKEIITDESSKYLIDQILCRKPYKILFDIGTAEWEHPSDRRKIEDVLSPLRNLLSLAPDRFPSIELVRFKFQDLLFQRNIIKSLPGHEKDRDASNARAVAIIIDIPRNRISQSTILVSQNKNIEENFEADLGVFGGGSQHGWIRSMVPRVYIHPSFRASGFDPHTMVELIRVASNYISKAS